MLFLYVRVFQADEDDGGEKNNDGRGQRLMFTSILSPRQPLYHSTQSRGLTAFNTFFNPAFLSILSTLISSTIEPVNPITFLLAFRHGDLRYESSTPTSKELSSPIFQSLFLHKASVTPDQISICFQ